VVVGVVDVDGIGSQNTNDLQPDLLGLMNLTETSVRLRLEIRSTRMVVAGRLPQVEIGKLLADRWGLTVEGVEPLHGGMNSATWRVTAGQGMYVAKVDEGDEAFGAGLETALVVEGAGIPAGAPLWSTRATVVEEVDGRQLAVLRHVDGSPLDGGRSEHREAIGSVLGRIHEATRTEAGDLVAWPDWLLSVFGDHLDIEPWIRPAVVAPCDEVRRLVDGVSWARLHGDPAPEAFLAGPAGEIGLIDWGAAMTAPALYDLASAVMYIGGISAGRDLVAAYLDERPGCAAEVDTGLAAFLRLRWAVQAGYFAWRTATANQTGLIDADAENAKGLADARRALTSRPA
jgi:Ser/Thr protein kinase RdoA (MazF antagonist)